MVRTGRPNLPSAKPAYYDIMSEKLRIGPAQIEVAKRWVVDKYPYNRVHLLRTLDWLHQIAPGTQPTVQMAALTHDMERAFPGPDQPVAALGQMNDTNYYKAHSERSARIVGAWLREQQIAPEDVERVEDMIRAHEFGGFPDANLVQAADSLSFLETNINLFLEMGLSGKRTWEEVEVKFDETFARIQVPAAKALAVPMYANAKDRLRLARSEKTGPNH